MPSRPCRITVVNQFGQRQSLDDHLDQFAPLPGMGEGVLLLGLGPNPAALADAIGAQYPVAYLEAPDFARQMPMSWRRAIPPRWEQTVGDNLPASGLLARNALFYLPNIRLYPDFWSPILAARGVAHIQPPQAAERTTVWLAATKQGLLAREISSAFMKAGLGVAFVPHDLAPADLFQRVRSHRPNLFFSVNFQGLDPYGQNIATLQALNIPVAVWCVDNPFHLLPAQKSRLWQGCTLFVTDDWFIRPLQEHGAQRVIHLPLATDPDCFQAVGKNNAPDLAECIVFVGRSSFPNKKAFFAGCTLHAERFRQAELMMKQGLRPDFGWWWNQFGLPSLWPGRIARSIGFAAEQCSQVWRAASLAATAESGRLIVYGDSAWRPLLPESADLRPEVDYYGPLTEIYRQARYTLNVTSLLLPRGLTQRHFDVWAAGGFLLTDSTPGLDIFDQELAFQTSFDRPGALRHLVDRLEKDHSLAAHLRTAWQRHILEKHTYDKRADRVLEATQSGSA